MYGVVEVLSSVGGEVGGVVLLFPRYLFVESSVYSHYTAVVGRSHCGWVGFNMSSQTLEIWPSLTLQFRIFIPGSALSLVVLGSTLRLARIWSYTRNITAFKD